MSDMPKDHTTSLATRALAIAELTFTMLGKATGAGIGAWLVLYFDHWARGDDGLLRWLTSTDITIGQMIIVAILAVYIAKD